MSEVTETNGNQDENPCFSTPGSSTILQGLSIAVEKYVTPAKELFLKSYIFFLLSFFFFKFQLIWSESDIWSKSSLAGPNCTSFGLSSEINIFLVASKNK